MKQILSIVMVFMLLALSLPTAYAADKESVYDRVMQTGEIRCGYAIWDPVLYKDLEKNVLSGIMYDLMNEVGERLDFKVEWTEESGWGTIVEGLHTGRYDMICAGLGHSSARAKFIDFGTPLFYTPMYAAVKDGDTRFDADVYALNDPAYKISVMDGELSSVVARQSFSAAQTVSLPQVLDYSMLLKEVEMSKADATLVEPSAFREYEKNNPGKLKLLDGGDPINVFPVSVGLPRGDMAFNRMIDVTLTELINDGTVERLLRRYERYPEAFLRTAKPYQPYRKD
ncbi:MAG: amino acid ABC transporter substrate-binding protein [Rhodospirillales bacterium]|nr:amino acid ABC transporter substrate-binding protein [Rhodospirillales bacterium]